MGGHCLPIDPSYLSWRVRRRLGQSFRFVELADDVNDHMPDYVARRLMAALNRRRLALNGSRILVLGGGAAHRPRPLRLRSGGVVGRLRPRHPPRLPAGPNVEYL